MYNESKEIREAIQAGERALHSLYEAKQCIEAANRDLQIFQRELSDVNMNFNLQIDVSGLLTVFDFLFDGFIADMMVQSKLNKAKDAVDRAIPQVQSALNRLKSYQ